MDRPTFPHEAIEEIFERSGESWTEQDRDYIYGWLFEEHRLSYLLSFAWFHLGAGASYQDAEDAWHNFFSTNLKTVIDRYDPKKGCGFWKFLLICFKRFCHREGDKIRKRSRDTIPLDSPGEEDGVFIELELVNADSCDNPAENIEQEEKRAIIAEALEKCLNKLKPIYRDVIVMYYFEGKPISTIVEEANTSESNINENNVKTRLYRARQQLREYLDYLCAADRRYGDIFEDLWEEHAGD